MCHRKTGGWASREKPKREKLKKMERIMVKTKAQLEELVKESALTWEGLDTSDESLKQVFDWLKGYTPLKCERVYITSGGLMDVAYGLTGTNAYPANLSIVSVRLCDMEKPMAIAIPRFRVGGRWLDDIVSNNRRREEEKLNG